MICKCGTHTASFNFRDEVMPVEIVSRLYCPQCASGVAFDAESMLKDNGWLIEYDMDVARFMAHKLSGATITPEYLFDQGYCTWRGVYPTDHIDSVKEREELVKLSKINPKKYLDEIRKWGIERMDRLAAEGWRKANAEQ
jgi:ABC-type amino acid transport substrate-binding protein